MSCCISDLLYGKIPNLFWIVGSVCGFVLHAAMSGRKGAGDSLLGFLFPFVLGFLLFYFRMMGAGDIKELMALGALLGVRRGIRVSILSIILGAGFSLVILLTERSFRERFMYFGKWVIRQAGESGKIPYRPEREESRTYTCPGKIMLSAENFHFTVPVFMAVLLLSEEIL